MEQSAAIIISDGFEEIEMSAILDILRRGGISVSVIGYKSRTLVGAHNLSIITDDIFSNISSQIYDCVILPGGPGCYKLRHCDELNEFLQTHFNKHKLICAICAAPLILYDAGILKNKKYTAHICTYDELTDAISSEHIVVDDNIITGSGPCASLHFGFTILKHLTDERTMHQLANSMLFCDKLQE